MRIAMERRFALAGVLAEHGVLVLRVEGAGVSRELPARLTDLPAELAGLAAGERIAGGGPGWEITISRDGNVLHVEITGEAGTLRCAMEGLVGG